MKQTSDGTGRSQGVNVLTTCSRASLPFTRARNLAGPGKHHVKVARAMFNGIQLKREGHVPFIWSRWTGSCKVYALQEANSMRNPL